MINYVDARIMDLLPENFESIETEALGYALNKMLYIMYQYTELVKIYVAIESMPDKILDVLAIELRTMYYDQSMDIESKRSLIKNTLLWYIKAGTPAAVEELINIAFGDGKVIEWFEFDGEPGIFKIQTENLSTPESMSLLNTMIHKVKNTRSHLGSISVVGRDIDNKAFVGTGNVQHSKTYLYEGS